MAIYRIFVYTKGSVKLQLATVYLFIIGGEDFPYALFYYLLEIIYTLFRSSIDLIKFYFSLSSWKSTSKVSIIILNLYKKKSQIKINKKIILIINFQNIYKKNLIKYFLYIYFIFLTNILINVFYFLIVSKMPQIQL